MGRDRFSTLFAVVRLKGLQASHTRYRAVLYKSDARIAAGPSKGIAVSFPPSSFTRKYKIVGDHSIYRIMCARAVCVWYIARSVRFKRLSGFCRRKAFRVELRVGNVVGSGTRTMTRYTPNRNIRRTDRL